LSTLERYPEQGGRDPVLDGIYRVIATLGRTDAPDRTSTGSTAPIADEEQVEQARIAALIKDKSEVLTSVREDRRSFLKLADNVVGVFEGAVDLLVVDGRSGHFVGGFLAGLMGNLAAARGVSPPRVLAVANSRRLAGSEHHQRAIRRYLQTEIDGRAPSVMIATEYVRHGDTLSRLGDHLEAAGAAKIGYAILCAYDTLTEVQNVLGRNGARQVCVGQTSVYEPALRSRLMSEATGLVCADGQAAPQAEERARPEIMETAQQAFDTLLAAYIRGRDAA
jgi:hypothetical protein